MELAGRLIRKQPSEAETLLNEEVFALRAAWNTGRDLAFNLRPWELDIFGGYSLPNALKRHIGRFGERTGAISELKTDDAETKELRPEVAFGLTRRLQQSLTNTVRHGKISRSEVELNSDSGRNICAAIRDNEQNRNTEYLIAGVGLAARREHTEKNAGVLSSWKAPPFPLRQPEYAMQISLTNARTLP